ncbi:MAG: fibronectin type III domain-containing protein [Eubacterium sp.]|nr:fibronectin type III domain-containing protein [Eubacterium sp.]
MRKKAISMLLTLVVIICAVSPVSYASYASSYADTLRSAGFPESYISDLVKLHKKYPNWQFKPFKTGIKWEDAVYGERAISHKQQIIQMGNLSEGYFCQCDNCTYSNGNHKVVMGPDWVCVSQAGLKYFMDPRNWLDVEHIFQFESTKYNSKQTKGGVESILSPTWMYKSNIEYKNTKGNTVTFKLSGNTMRYSTAIMKAAKNSGMSAYFLASKIVQEVGATRSSAAGGSSGTKQPFIGIFNYYNIGAYSNASQGLEWATGYLKTNRKTYLYSKYDSDKKQGAGSKTSVSEGHYLAYRGDYGDYYKVKLYTTGGTSFSTDGKVGYIKKDAVRTTYLTYGRPWTNPYKTIKHGAEYIHDGYGKYQYTGYLQKFNVNDDSGALYNHEYSTAVAGPSGASEMAYKAYKKAGILSDARVFYIPVYKSMPKTKCRVGSADSDETENDSDSTDRVTGLKLTKRTQETLSFKWDKYSSASKYYIYIKNLTKGSTFDKTVTDNSATLKGLTPAHEYLVKVKAKKSGGWSDYSKKKVRHTIPPKAGSFKLKERGSISVKFSFDEIEGADGYYFYRYSKTKKKYLKLDSCKSSPAVIKGFHGGNRYKVCYAAFTKDSKIKVGKKSKLLTITTKPERVTLKPLKPLSNSRIKVRWAKQGGRASGYQIYWAKDKKFKNIIAKTKITDSSQTYYIGANFTKGKTYYVKVRAYRIIGKKKYYSRWSTIRKTVSK